MSEVTEIFQQIEHGDAVAAEKLIPLVYNELRRQAADRLQAESQGQTLQATALVHEEYLRLVDPGERQSWDSRGHFFAAAGESMRRIQVEAFDANPGSSTAVIASASIGKPCLWSVRNPRKTSLLWMRPSISLRPKSR